MNLLSLVLRRAAHHWQMLATLGLGVIIATALLAAGPVLVNTVVEFGLRRSLLAADPLAGNLVLRAFGRTDADEFAAHDAAVRTTVATRLDPYQERIVSSVGARWLFPWVDDVLLADERLIPRVYGDDKSLRAHAELVAGTWPTGGANGDTFRAVIGEELAAAYGLAAGDRLPLSAGRDESAPTFFMEVAGIIRPLDADDPYWFGALGPLRSQSDDRYRAQYSALVAASDYFPMAAALFPNAPQEVTWYVMLDPARFTTGDIALVRGQLPELAADLRGLSPSVAMDTRLGDVLGSFAAQSNAVRVPLYFLTAEVVLLALYYVVMVASLAVRQVEREFAVLQSRGASGRQMFRLQLVEALLAAMVAMLAGPLLGVALVRALTTFGPLADVSEPGWSLTLPQLAWLAAAVGALACLVGLLLPVGPAINRSIVTYRQDAARSARPPWWQRAYLDVILLVVGLLLFWRLRVYGGIVAGGGVDWLLLLSPLALLIGAGTILLRVFPPILNGLAALAARGRSLPAALALWQAARNPTHAARLVLLLTLAIALGILTTGINATLDTSEAERARYAAGGELRLSSRGAAPVGLVQDGDTAVSRVYRTEGSASIGRAYLRFGLLGIDPFSFGPITRYRPDFAARPMGELLGEIAAGASLTSSTVELPGAPLEVGVWIWSAPEAEARRDSSAIPQGDIDLDRLGVSLRLVSAQGETLAMSLRPAENGDAPNGWRYFRATLPALSVESYPLVVDNLTLRNRARSQGGFSRELPESMELVVDELTVMAGGQRHVVADAERALALPLAAEAAGSAVFGPVHSRDGEGALGIAVAFGPGEALTLLPGEPIRPPDTLPALVSPAFLTAVDAAVGDPVNVAVDSRPLTLRVAGVVDYFPTLYDDLNGGFAVVNRDALLAFLNNRPDAGVNANEVLLETTGARGPEEVAAAAAELPALASIEVADAIRRAIKADPMGLGLRSVTLFGYALTALLSLVGFATYFYFSARQRESIYGVLRSIGLSPCQLYVVLLLEQLVLILAGLAIGTALGLVLNRITLPGLPITFGDRPPTPPFLARNDWAAIGRIYLTILVAFLLALGAATALLWRTNLHRALRVGEE